MKVDIVSFAPVTVTLETKAELNDFLQILHDYNQIWHVDKRLHLAGVLLDLIRNRLIG